MTSPDKPTETPAPIAPVQGALNGFCWRASIKASVVDPAKDATVAAIIKEFPNAKVIDIAGCAVDETVNKNKWAVALGELKNIADQFNAGKVTLRANHGSRVEDVKGRVMGAFEGEQETAFHARIISEDPNFLIPVMSGAVDHVSIQADPAKAVCSKCAKNAMPFLSCDCKGNHVVISGLKVRELSIVADPAYQNTSFKTLPMGFASMVNEKVEEAFRMTEDEATKKAALEAAAMKAEEDKKAEEEKKKAEEEKKKKAQEEEDKKTEIAALKKEIADAKAELDKVKKASHGKSAALTPPLNDEMDPAMPAQTLLDAGTGEVLSFFASIGIMPSNPSPQYRAMLDSARKEE